VLYIDGFAGPGQYTSGEPGSPIIALDVAINHSFPISAEVVFLFVEADDERAAHLEEVLAEKSLPPNFKYRVFNSKFAEVIPEVLDYIEEQRRRLAPAFVFVDPFGYSHTPFEIIKRLLQNRRCEVLITFMYQFINRFVSDQTQWDHLDSLYGTSQWREVLTVEDAAERKAILHGVYQSQLEQGAGGKYVLPFEMEDPSGQTEYFLFFCTNSLTGFSKMKQAMWAVDPTGNFRYAYARNPNQMRLFDTDPDFLSLRTELSQAFAGQTVKVEDVEEFVLLHTQFLDTHYKRQVLIPMEKEGAIEVTASPRRNRYSYPPNTVIRFI
jgi:three-Cys-motif partner protein